MGIVALLEALMATLAPIPAARQDGLEDSAVLAQLKQILESPLFCNSKRYPAFLEYVVRETLAGNVDRLKERTIGIDVFHRAPDYDSNADPVVRVTAGEVRKRIAQFYHDASRASDLRIDLPSGSYIAEFHAPLEPYRAFRPDGAVLETALDSKLPSIPSTPSHVQAPETSEVSRGTWAGWKVLAFCSTVMMLGAIALAAIGWQRSTAAPMARSAMWNPLLKSGGTVLLVVGQPAASPSTPESQTESMAEEMKKTKWRMAFSDAVAVAQLAAMLNANHTQYTVLGTQSSTLSDLRHRPVVLIGGFNNEWTQRLLAPLRFTLHEPDGAEGQSVRQIVDRKNPSATPWTLDMRLPFKSVTKDYAIVGRFKGEMTDDVSAIVAGLGANATEGAAEFMTTPEYLKQLDHLAPKNWNNMNMEAVLEVEVINGKAGHPQVIAADFWQ
jgi:hypothetical protein